MDRTERFNQADQVIRIGFLLNAVLMVMKLLAGHFGKSEAVFADGIESACDFVAILSTMVALRISRRPLDKRHPYGHGRAESIAALVVAGVIFLTGTGILYRAVDTILHHGLEKPTLIAVLAALVTIVIKEGLYRYSVRTGTQLGSPSLLAVAKDHRKDALTSIATLIGVTGAFFGLRLMDPIAAGLTAFFIFKIGYETFVSGARDLMDADLPDGVIRDMTRLAEGISGVEHVHEIKGRRSGQYLIVDLKLEMDPEMTVRRSHEIATNVKKAIFDKFPSVGDVMIHVNPHDDGSHQDLIRL